MAFLAGLATGFWKNKNEIEQIFHVGKSFVPQMSLNEREHLYKGWKCAVKATQVFKHE